MRIGPHELPNRLFVAPMAGVTDRPFRQLCRQLGAGYANHADFRLPNGRYAQNSRFNEAVLKSVLSFNGKRSVHHLRYSFSHTTTGIPGHTHDSLATPESFQVADQRRTYTLPAQFFNNHFLSSDTNGFANNRKFSCCLVLPPID